MSAVWTMLSGILTPLLGWFFHGSVQTQTLTTQAKLQELGLDVKGLTGVPTAANYPEA
jgi:hypothetical protein